jgi:AcrR family transcriptional regulator
MRRPALRFRTFFLDRGFDGVTVDEIAAEADVSKRSFFDYFPAKEDVIFAWQDAFGEALAAAVVARPVKEPLAITVEEALTSSITVAAHPAALAVDELIGNTPALRKRDYLKYARLEQTLAGARMKRVHGEKGRFRAQLLAVIAIGGLRLGNEEWRRRGMTNPAEAHDFTRKVFRQVWTELHDAASAALMDQPQKSH